VDARPGQRLLANLPALYAERDGSGDLARLLGVFEALFLDGGGDGEEPLGGLERSLRAIPGLFLPAGETVDCELPGERHTPDRFLAWLLEWLAFTPYEYFDAAARRRIAAGIVPLYGWRGTRYYLEQLLALCFPDEFEVSRVEDRRRGGFVIGESRLGSDTRLALQQAFRFRVIVAFRPGRRRSAELEHRLRVVIDFAKPAHTAYELDWMEPQTTRAGEGLEGESHD
jgi:phage tail-like protein